jgi:hypothetical protein
MTASCRVPSSGVDACQTYWEHGGLAAALIDRNPPVDPRLLTVAGDGCDPAAAAEPASVWPVIDHLRVAQYRSVFGPRADEARLALEPVFVEESYPDLLVAYDRA